MESGQVAEPVVWKLEVPNESTKWYTSGRQTMEHWVKSGAVATALCVMPTPSAIEAWASLIANGLLGQASEDDVREVELKIWELLGVGT